tara:strand:+ start:1839 stop:2738 length:900 start_codon:yes stop_codon:yes gene_type:complete
MTIQNLFNEDGAIFMGARRDKNNCSIGIFGVNYDGTTSFKPGARFGPSAIRNVSQSLETFCPRLEKDLEEIKYIDFGSLSFDLNTTESLVNQVSVATEHLRENNLKPLIFGGEHSITTGAIRALIKEYPNLILLQLDAHADLRDSYGNNQHSHACTMKRCMEILPNKTIFQVGIRSGTKEEFQEMKDNNQLINFRTGDNCKNLVERLHSLRNYPIYLTIDLDWFDPSLLPGTGTPEPGGFFWHDFETIIKALNSFNIIGGDIVELAPEIDSSGVSSVVAAKVARSLIMTLDNNSEKELS